MARLLMAQIESLFDITTQQLPALTVHARAIALLVAAILVAISGVLKL